MIRGLLMIFSLVVSASPEAQWTQSEVLGIFQAANQMASSPGPQQASSFVQLFSAAYGHKPLQGEDLEGYARRFVRAKRPSYPPVAKGQWVPAAMSLLYQDVAVRTERILLLARRPKEQKEFGILREQCLSIAGRLERSLQFHIEGLDNFTQPLPRLEGKVASKRGAMVLVRTEGIEAARLVRVRFGSGLQIERALRTKTGALKSLVTTFQELNQRARLLGRYDRELRKKRGHITLAIPASFPAGLLHEVAQAAVEGGMKKLHLLGMSKEGKLVERGLFLESANGLHCSRAETVSQCTKRLGLLSKGESWVSFQARPKPN